MTQLLSPSSRSSSETSRPSDLASGLTARLQAASFQPLATDCAVFPDFTSFGVDVPSLLPSLAEEELVSLTDRGSSKIGNGHDMGQLVQQSGKSIKEENLFAEESLLLKTLRYFWVRA